MDVNANNIEATFDVEMVELSSEFDIEQQNFDALFSINAAGTTWGSIEGNIENQADLIAILNTKATNEALTALATTVTNNYTTLDTKIDGVQSDLSGNISVLETAVQNEAATRANNDTLLQNDINTLTSNLSAEISNRATADNTLQSNINSLSNTVTNNYTTLDGKITTINNTLSDYGNIVTHNVAEFATAAQGLLADTALQPNDNISELNNNVGYITGISSADVTNALGYTPYNTTNPNGYISGIDSTDVVTALGYTPYDSANPDGYITSASLPTVNNNTITIQKNNTDVGSFTLNQSSNDTINITVPTDTQDLTNGAGFITSADLPTLSDLATNTQMAAINSGATAEKIDQINTNTGDIFNEIINRQLADNALQSQIDAIVASSDVFDIVGTYAELQAYNISIVPVNDIIKVLVDSTHNNAATYYRCVENNNVKSWSYIGSEGAYYTKGEADSKFVEKTITINGQPLSSNITLTASDVNALPSSTTIGAGVLTVQKNGTTIDTFGANDTGNTTINITVPTDTGDLTNNAGFITGITGTDVTNALGYTPYDSSNPSGYTSNVGTVTSVNNISPVSGNVTLSIPTTTSDLTNDSGFITSSDLTNYVDKSSNQSITGTKTFVGQKKIGFKQSNNTDKLGFTLYTNNNTEKGYLEFNPANTVDSVPLMTLGNFASSAAALTHVGFRKYSGVTNESGAYNLLAPLISDAKTPFNLTTTYTNFYLPLGFTDGTTTVKTAKSGLVDLSSILPIEVTETTVAGWGFTKNAGTVTSVNNTQPDANGNVTITIPSSATWGNITGTLSDQTDLQTALDGKLANTATGTNSLTILGSVTSASASINIGSSSTATRSNSISIGNNANTVSQYSVAIGYNAKAGTSSDSSNGAVAIGYNAGGDYSKGNTVAVGNNAVAKSTGSIAIGNSAEVGNTNYTNGIAIGNSSQVYGANSINLGYGANTTANTLSVGFYGQNSNHPYTLLNGTTGLIPDERLSSNIARTSQLPSRNIGEIVQSTIPLTDAGLHLLDGSLISGSGSYADFVTYIAELVNDYPNLFVTEANWQTSVTTYGVCGKFVYSEIIYYGWYGDVYTKTTQDGATKLYQKDIQGNFVEYQEAYDISISTNLETLSQILRYTIPTSDGTSTINTSRNTNLDTTIKTVRLPKITGIIEGTVDATALGDLVEAGLPNITGGIGVYNSGNTYGSTYWNDNNVQGTSISGTGGANGHVAFNASRSNAIYGNSNTVQPQTIKAFIYIVIATSAKTDIQVDIDEIATDLNGKADTSLANLNNTGKIAIAHNAMPSGTYTNLTLGASGTGYIAPADGWFVLEKVAWTSNTAQVNPKFMEMINNTNHFSDYDSANWQFACCCSCPAKKGDDVYIGYDCIGTTLVFRFIYAVGSESEHS